MQRPGTRAVRTQIKPSKPKREITKTTKSQNTKRTYLTSLKKKKKYSSRYVFMADSIYIRLDASNYRLTFWKHNFSKFSLHFV